MIKPHPDKIFIVSLIARSRPGAQEILQGVFEQIGIDRHRLVVQEGDTKVRVETYVPGLPVAKGLSRKLEHLELKGVRFRCEKIIKDDWAQSFSQRLQPFAISPSFDVVPHHAKSLYHPCHKEFIILDVNMAFGTGLHETTRFMVELIESCRGKFRSFLDVGTGTGILSIVAFKCQATSVVSLDVDPASIRTVRNNWEYNNLPLNRCIETDFRKWQSREHFDFVAANLLTDDLIALKRKLLARVRPRQYLALSGIALENLARLRDAFKELPLACVRIKRGQQWAAVLYRRNPM